MDAEVRKRSFAASWLNDASRIVKDKRDKQQEWRDENTDGLSVVVYPSGKTVFYFSMSWKKRRFRMRLGEYPLLTISQARKKSIELRADIQRGEIPVEGKRVAALSFSDAAKQYLEHTKQTKKSHRDDVSKCRHWLLPALGSKPLSALTTVMVERYHAKMAKARTPATANRHLALIKAILTHAVKEKWIAESPAKGISPFPEVRTARKYLTRSEARQFLAALETEPDREQAALLEFLLVTGIRAGTARAALLEHYDATKGTLFVPMTKSGKGQIISLSARAQAIIEAQMLRYGLTGYLFRRSDGVSPIYPPNGVMKRVCQHANLSGFTPHSLRHTFALLSLETGASPYQLQQVLGHEALSTTMVYAAIGDETQRGVAESVANQLYS